MGASEYAGSHVDAGLCCLAAHFDSNGNLLPSCIICKNCGQHIRREDMKSKCPGFKTSLQSSPCAGYTSINPIFEAEKEITECFIENFDPHTHIINGVGAE